MKNKNTYLDGTLYESLWKNAKDVSGVTYHFVYEKWAKTDGLWTIHKFVNGELDEDSIDYYRLRKGVHVYLNKPECSCVFVYRYSKKDNRFNLYKKQKSNYEKK